MFADIFTWADNHQGILAIVLFIASILVALVAFLLEKIFFADKATQDFSQTQRGGDRSMNIQAGGDLNVKR